jgi:hypothetical protein
VSGTHITGPYHREFYQRRRFLANRPRKSHIFKNQKLSHRGAGIGGTII